MLHHLLCGALVLSGPVLQQDEIDPELVGVSQLVQGHKQSRKQKKIIFHNLRFRMTVLCKSSW